jgi:molybdenum cofactor cytidylyltransferase
VAILNQADSAEKLALAQRLAQQLLPTFHSVLVAALQNNISPEDQVKACYEPVAGILLAAGGSRRLGQPKQLLSWHNQPLVRHIACTGLEAGLNPLIVITGAYHDEVQAALADLPVQVVHNPAWQEGQSTSLRAGLSALPSYVGAAVFLLSDQPYLTPCVIRALRDLHASTLAPAIVPLVEDRRTNPVLFDCATFGDLMQTSGDVGGRALFNRYPVTYLPWLDENLLIDVDTPQDVDRLYGSVSL